MPVTFQPAKHGAISFDPTSVRQKEPPTSTAHRILSGACAKQSLVAGEMLQSTFSMNDAESSDTTVVPEHDGLVGSVVKAYNKHYALVIRPDDVWLAILSQFSAFVNANAEELRHLFVAHEGKKELIVHMLGTRYTVDFSYMATTMTGLIHENVKDPSLRDWIIPNFTTTTSNDRTVGAILMMATMKKYFDYTCCITCGIPRVTLAGEKSDWESLVTRIEKLKEYGSQTTAWHHLLHPVFTRFVAAFDDPDGSSNLDFWGRVAHYQSGGSGPSYYSGWITAFCVFDEEGRWIGPSPYTEEHPALVLDNVKYHRVNAGKLPPGYAEVDVKIVDNGVEVPSVMVAGMVASQFFSSGDTTLSESGKHDTIHPTPGWWIYEKGQETYEEYQARQRREMMARLDKLREKKANRA